MGDQLFSPVALPSDKKHLRLDGSRRWTTNGEEEKKICPAGNQTLVVQSASGSSLIELSQLTLLLLSSSHACITRILVIIISSVGGIYHQRYIYIYCGILKHRNNFNCSWNNNNNNLIRFLECLPPSKSLWQTDADNIQNKYRAVRKRGKTNKEPKLNTIINLKFFCYQESVLKGYIVFTQNVPKSANVT